MILGIYGLFKKVYLSKLHNSTNHIEWKITAGAVIFHMQQLIILQAGE